MKRQAVRQTVITNLSPMERCELLHSVGSVCSTPWRMRWTRWDWAIVTNPVNNKAKLIIARSRSISINSNLAQACLKGVSSEGINLDFVLVGMYPSLVLKSRNMKCCLNQPKMLSLSNMTYESRLCSEKVVNTSTHMI